MLASLDRDKTLISCDKTFRFHCYGVFCSGEYYQEFNMEKCKAIVFNIAGHWLGFNLQARYLLKI